MESFFHSLKADLVHCSRFLTEAELRTQLGRYGITSINACAQRWVTDHPLTMNDEPCKNICVH
jgi:hypothetical protein